MCQYSETIVDLGRIFAEKLAKVFSSERIPFYGKWNSDHVPTGGSLYSINAPISGSYALPLYTDTRGLMEGRRGIDSPHTWGTNLHTIPLHTPQISLSCTVCDREIWVFVEFTKNLPKTFNTTKENVYAIWVDWDNLDWVLATPSGKILTTNPPLFSNICLIKVCKVGHIPLIGAL